MPIVNIPPTISANTTWPAGSVYVISGLVTVNSGVTLSLQPGTIVKFQNSGSTKGKLLVNGALQAPGTASQPVIFTSINDDSFGGDTNQNGGATRPGAGDWDSLTISTTTFKLFPGLCLDLLRRGG